MSPRWDDEEPSEPAIELTTDDSAVTEIPMAQGKSFSRDRTRPAPTLPPLEFDATTGTSGSLASRPSLLTLGRAGARALRRFPGLCATIYLIQVGISAAAAAIMAALLADAFARRPMFDRAMEGDLTALVGVFQQRPGLLDAIFLVGAGALLLYWLLSLFVTGGLIAVFLDPPSRRREVARWFGAGGAATFLPLLRLTLWSILPYASVLFAFTIGSVGLETRLTRALDVGDLIGPLAMALGPALFLHWIIGTAIDYARIDLVRHPGMSSLRALVRGFRVLLTRPLALLHTASYGLFFVLVTVAYVVISGSLGQALLLAIILRQATSLLRFIAHVALLAGQVELACSAMPNFLGKRRG